MTTLKSVCLGVLVMEDCLSIEDGFKLSRVEEDYQIEWNGFVEGAHDIEEAQLGLNVAAAKLVRDLC